MVFIEVVMKYSVNSDIITLDIRLDVSDITTWLEEQGAILLDFQQHWYTKHWRVNDFFKLLFLLKWA